MNAALGLLTVIRDELFLRLLSSLIGISLFAYCFYEGEAFFLFLLFAVAAGLFYEWWNISKNALCLFGLGGIYIFLGLLAGYGVYQYSPDVFLWMVLLVWTNDTGAFMVGKCLKGPKLAPKISPGKTWSGFFGGIILATVAGAYMNQKYFKIGISPLLGSLVAIIGNGGDLLESGMKRYFKVKDSSHLIPGHGGFLDRFDSFLAASLFVYVLIKIL